MLIKSLDFNEKSINTLLDVFFSGFKNLTDTAEKDEKDMLLNVCPSIFRKWFYSALIDDTPLTPSNIIRSTAESDVRVSVKAFYDENKNICFTSEKQIDSLDKSLFVNDIKYLCQKCIPAGEYDFSSTENVFSLAQNFEEAFIKDGYYISYIALIAQRLSLISPMPSINTVKYQINNDVYNKFFSLSPLEIHKKLIDTVLDIFIENISKQLQTPMSLFNKYKLIDIIKTSCITDEIFAYVYTAMGFDFEKIADLGQSTSLSEEDEALVSSVLFLGVLIDKWLITPLGYYMGLLSPAYASPYSFSEDYDYIRPVLTTGCDLSFELFAPANYYVLTDKGEEIFGCTQKNKSSFTINGKVTETDLGEIIQAYDIFTSVFSSSLTKKQKSDKIYRLKISFKNDSSMWKILDMPHNSTLAELKEKINTFFGFPDTDSYGFEYNGNVYKTGEKFKFINSAEKITLDSLVISCESSITYSNGLDKNLDLDIVVDKITKAEKNSLYPRLWRQSRNITEKERNGDF